MNDIQRLAMIDRLYCGAVRSGSELFDNQAFRGSLEAYLKAAGVAEALAIVTTGNAVVRWNGSARFCNIMVNLTRILSEGHGGPVTYRSVVDAYPSVIALEALYNDFQRYFNPVQEATPV